MQLNIKRILIVTDSLGAPRFVNNEKIIYNDTWVYKVISFFKKDNIEFIFLTVNGLDSRKLLQLTRDKLLLYEADMVVFEFGIVDCAPRVFKDSEIKLLSFLKLSWIVRRVVSKYHAFFSNLRAIQQVGLKEFTKNISQVYTLFNERNTKIIHIPIAPACKQYVKKSPQIDKNINIYNEIIKKYTDCYLCESYKDCDVETIFLKDLHHLNEQGHNLLADNVILNLKKILDYES